MGVESADDAAGDDLSGARRVIDRIRGLSSTAASGASPSQPATQMSAEGADPAERTLGAYLDRNGSWLRLLLASVCLLLLPALIGVFDLPADALPQWFGPISLVGFLVGAVATAIALVRSDTASALAVRQIFLAALIAYGVFAIARAIGHLSGA